jgi:uncharacterized protein (DUF1810 family)
MANSTNDVTMATPDPHDLARFVAAQEATYAAALQEVTEGRKRSHWMWFVFPQLQGLGSSSTARFYAIRSTAEAKAYLEHPVLGPRLQEISAALLAIEGKSARDIFGSPDDLKLRSSATLFGSVSAPGSVFEHVLEKFFDGEPDPETRRMLGAL